MNFSKHITDERDTVVLLLKAVNENGPYYAYILLPADKEQAFYEAVKDADTVIEDWGVILRMAQRHEPSKDDKAWIKETFGKQEE